MKQTKKKAKKDKPTLLPEDMERLRKENITYEVKNLIHKPKTFKGFVFFTKQLWKFDPDIAKEIGLENAIILHQLCFWQMGDNNGKVLADGNRWMYNTYDDWLKHFSWMTAITLRRRIKELEDCGALMSCQPEGSYSRRKYYRVNPDVIKDLQSLYGD